MTVTGTNNGIPDSGTPFTLTFTAPQVANIKAKPVRSRPLFGYPNSFEGVADSTGHRRLRRPRSGYHHPDQQRLNRLVIVPLPAEIDMVNAGDVGEQLRAAFASGVSVVIDLATEIVTGVGGRPPSHPAD
jgi:hypothetical protein